MLKQYEHPDAIIQESNKSEWLFEAKLNYLVSEVMNALHIEDADEMATSLKRAVLACGSLELPLHRNFKKVFRSDGENMIMDWKLSPLACYLIVINCNPGNEHVARAQLYFAFNRIIHT